MKTLDRLEKHNPAPGVHDVIRDQAFVRVVEAFEKIDGQQAFASAQRLFMFIAINRQRPGPNSPIAIIRELEAKPDWGSRQKEAVAKLREAARLLSMADCGYAEVIAGGSDLLNKIKQTTPCVGDLSVTENIIALADANCLNHAFIAIANAIESLPADDVKPRSANHLWSEITQSSLENIGTRGADQAHAGQHIGRRRLPGQGLCGRAVVCGCRRTGKSISAHRAG